MEPTTLDPLIGDWSVYQLAKGHRFSTDDLVTAWRAGHAAPDARRLLDLGCGIGSVGLCTLHRMHPEATLTGVEVQEVSADLARSSVSHNGLDERVEIRTGDLRDPDVLPAGSTFDLITGSPPYVPLGSGIVSPHPQRAGARMELKGSVFDYCLAARRWLAPGGRFCFVMLAGDPRTEAAPREAGFEVVERYDYVFGADRAPHIATLVCALPPAPPRRTGQLVIRGPDGEWTDAYQAFRSEMGARPR